VGAVITDTSLVNLLADALGGNAPLNVRLFKTDVPGNPTVTLGTLVEADFSGYAPVTITPAVASSTEEDDTATTQEFDLTFAHSGGAVSNSLYGYYVTSDGTGGQKLMWMERDEQAPISMSGLGDEYEVLIQVLATQEV
jgi:hypothetical protein